MNYLSKKQTNQVPHTHSRSSLISKTKATELPSSFDNCFTGYKPNSTHNF